MVIVFTISGLLFLNFHPVFGGKISKEIKEKYSLLANYKEGIFINEIPTTIDIGFLKGLKIMGEFVGGSQKREPSKPIPLLHLDSLDIVNHSKDSTRLTWFGHSAFLLEIEGKRILLDPMFGISPAPLQAFGPKRFSKELPITIQKLPFIDAVVISHDHYDHLDHGSILKLKEKVGLFFVPLGVGSHLRKWGVAKEKIRELNWWDNAAFKDLQLVCTPARHFSGRGLLDRYSTLWCSWIIKSNSKNIYFSGDGGYGSHFKQIGDKYGPFHFAMIECGQYNENWPDIHMLPEETVMASKDLNAAVMMPIHWGAFTLAMHSWIEPVERASTKALETGVLMATPIIGEQIILESESFPKTTWWKSLN